MAGTWRLESRPRAHGLYWFLRTGRGADRKAVSLRYLAEAEARAALARIQAEEDAGTVARVLALCERDLEAGVQYLVGDPAVTAMMEREEPCWALSPLERYVGEVYGPWRESSRPQTWRTEKSHWPRILEVLGSTRLQDVDEFRVADYLDGLMARRGAREGRTVSGNTKRLHRSAVQACLRYAYRQRHIAALPELARFRIEGSTTAVTTKPAPLTLEELIAMMDVSRDVHRCLWAVGAGEGLRPGELVALDWADVDWERRLLTVRGTKTEASHAVIPLTPLAWRELGRWRERAGRIDGPIFTIGGKRIREYKTAIKSAAAAAGIERRVYPYLLRDSFASIAWSLGIEMDVARRVMRHVDERMLMQVYCRPRPEELVRLVQAFDVPSRT